MNDVLVDRKAWIKTEIITVAVVTGLLLVLCLGLPVFTQNVTSTWYRNYNQYLIGPLVNAALIYSGLRFKKVYNVIGVILMPSICVAVLGLIGINAIFMIYMIPFIWLGNMAIVFSFRLMFRKNKNKTVRYVITAILGVGLKVSIIFCAFLVLRSFGVFPGPVAERLYTMMGVVQFITATCGAVIAFGAVRLHRTKLLHS